MPHNLSRWIVTTIREAGWVPVVMLFLLVITSQVFDLFKRFPEFDVLMHFFGGVATGFFFHRVYVNASRFGILQPYHAVTHYLLVFGSVCTAAVFWEFAEFFYDSLFGAHTQLSNQDTMSDLLLGTLGVASFLLAFAMSRR